MSVVFGTSKAFLKQWHVRVKATYGLVVCVCCLCDPRFISESERITLSSGYAADKCQQHVLRYSQDGQLFIALPTYGDRLLKMSDGTTCWG